jgi:hypothetical protein
MRRSWPKRRGSLLAAVALGLVPLSVCTAAAAAPSARAAVGAWTIQPSPNEPGATASTLTAVSCVKTGPCAAVGTYYTATGEPRHQYALALERTGAKWVLEPTPTIKGVGYSLFNGVSCVSASSCLAVGYTVTSAADNPKVRALAERWNGTSWTVDSPAAPAGPDPWAVLDDVSCPTTSFCLAVGGYFKNLSGRQEQPLAEEWNGTSWAQLTAPNPHAENGSEFTSVACVSARTCEVDGDYDYADVAQSVFGYGYNGTSWTPQKQVNPSGQEANADNSVSCTSASACTSAGYWTSIGLLGLAEGWNGTTWSRQSLPRPPKSDTDELSGVSCTTATACTAVGDSATSYSSSVFATMAMSWNGKSWQLASTPTPTGGGAFSAVSCTSPTDCVAVGSGPTSTLVEVSPAG